MLLFVPNLKTRFLKIVKVQIHTKFLMENILLTFYNKYGTYRCSTPNFFDCTVLINVKPIFFTIFLIFHEIEIFFGGFYSTYN